MDGCRVAVLVTIVAVVTYRRTRSPPHWLPGAGPVCRPGDDPDRGMHARPRPPASLRPRCGRYPRIPGPTGGGGHSGGHEEAPSGRHRNRDAAPAWLPVEAVAARLRQFDVRLDAIDIVSVGTRRTSGRDDVSDVGVDDTGPVDARQPLDEHHTWLVLRMDPQRNVAAVAARDSVAATLAAATERLAHDLNGRRWTARPVTSSEIDDMDATVLAGLQPAHVRPRRRRLKYKQPKDTRNL
ncbi:type VII secretion protein EccE [Mycobacterium xenopi 3993]|nr:type VII secretion protein EccE [Mycobacterium xenopi 3993]